MTTIGFDQPLYILPFDQRESFQTEMLGWEGDLTLAQRDEIAAAKAVIPFVFEESSLLPAETVGLTRQALLRWENEGGRR